MLFKQIWKNYKFIVISIFLYILITFPAMFFHIPWYDEAHSYLQAHFMNWNNWVDILKAEGHPILWFLMLLPFAKTNWLYPYPMLIINYICCLCAVVTVLLKAPFSKWIKIAIVFSSVFLIYFPIVARGYSTGVLFLFLLAVYYKDKLKHPIIYPILVALSLNMNIICGIAASWFGLVFFIELLKSNLKIKTKIVSISILVLSTLFFIYPFIGGFGYEDSIEYRSIGFKHLLRFFTVPLFIPLVIYLTSLIAVFLKTRFCVEQTFLIYTNIIMLILFGLIYPGYPHHFIFFYLLIIIFLWIYNNKYSDRENLPCSSIKLDFLSIIIMILLFYPQQKNLYYVFDGDLMKAMDVISVFTTDPEFKNSRILLTDKHFLLAPYLKNNAEVYTLCNLKALNWDTFITTKCLNGNKIADYFDNNKNLYLIQTKEIPGMPYYKVGYWYIYLVIKQGSKQ